MFGAIIGDIAGSRFEFDRPGWTKEFELFAEDSEFTDDTVLTIAILLALTESGKDASIDVIKTNCIKQMKIWGNRYPNAGYGLNFAQWLTDINPKPYNSLGNGSAMRVSAAGFLYDTLERTREVARATAEVSHNHPEGVKGAECTAAVIYLGRTGKTKEEIAKYVTSEFGYDISHTVSELIPLHKHDETCMDSMPKALIAFLESNSFEDCIRNAVAIGGDTDTIAAIAGGMAEGFYGIPKNLIDSAMTYLSDDIKAAIATYEANKLKFIGPIQLNKAISVFKKQTEENARNQSVFAILNLIINLIKAKAEVPAAFADVGAAVLGNSNKGELKAEDFFKLKSANILQLGSIKSPDGRNWVPLFTTNEEMARRKMPPVVMNCSIEEIIRTTYSKDAIDGVVINPFGDSMVLTKPLMKIIIDTIDQK